MPKELLGTRMASGLCNAPSYYEFMKNIGGEDQRMEGEGSRDESPRDSPVPEQEIMTLATAEYVKRTAKMFERPKKEPRQHREEDRKDVKCRRKLSYLGVSCSNSGYMNVLNYDSKVRQELQAPRAQISSLVLGRSVPERASVSLGTLSNTPRRVSHDMYKDPHMGPFVNISTSTKTISTFRQITDTDTTKSQSHEEITNKQPEKISLDLVIGKESRSKYSEIGGKESLKSPEKNCNSFLKSMQSFESQAKAPGKVVIKSLERRVERVSLDAMDEGENRKSFIQERIERLYGPSALARGFYHCPPKVKETRSCPVTPRSETRNEIRVSGDEDTSSEDVSSTNNVEPDTMSLEKQPEDTKAGYHFLKLLDDEIEKMAKLATETEKELEYGENLPEDVCGKLRAASGKARLLISQKMHQFEGLCHKNINQEVEDPFPTTSEDLQGFWDMISLQLSQVYNMFAEIEVLKKNDWKAVTSPKVEKTMQTKTTTSGSKKIPKNKDAGKKDEKLEAAKKAREENRKKMIEDKRKKMQQLKENKNINNDTEVEIYSK